MRIRELLENKLFKDADYVKHTGEKREIDFDLCEDLTYFMNHDDDVYRRHLFPAVARLIDAHKAKKELSPSIFKPAVQKSYKIYISKFPIRELPDEIEDAVCEEVCSKMHEDISQHISDGKYKD